MVQQRQWRKQHEDSHYAACLFRYEREYALLVRDHAIFVCIDDKHRIKVGEPDAPVSSAERGRHIIVHSGTSLQSSAPTPYYYYTPDACTLPNIGFVPPLTKSQENEQSEG